METREVRVGIPWDRRTPWERYVQDELGLPLVRSHWAGPLEEAAVGPWEARGLAAAFFDLVGAESLGALCVAELPPGASSRPARQLYDEVVFVLSGRGSTTVTTAGGVLSFEWGPRSLFALPLNCPFQLHNGSGREPARVLSVSTLPAVYNLFRDAAFLHGSEWDFGRLRPGLRPDEAVLYQPDPAHDRTAVDLYETLFVADALAVPRSRFAERSEGHRTVYFELADCPISCHVAEFVGGEFFNPHRHGPSAFVFVLEGSGYSLMWPDGGEPLRFDWPSGGTGVVVPPGGWWHGHFVTSPRAVHLAIKLRSRKHPLNHLYENTHKRVGSGGTVLGYRDLPQSLRERVWRDYADACAANGVRALPPRA